MEETLVRLFFFCSSSVYYHHISIPFCGHVWRLWPWFDHVPICFVVGAEWKETAKLQRGWRGKNQFSEDSVVKVDVIWGLKAPGCAWKYECFPFDQKFSLAFLEISSGKRNDIFWNFWEWGRLRKVCSNSQKFLIRNFHSMWSSSQNFWTFWLKKFDFELSRNFLRKLLYIM